MAFECQEGSENSKNLRYFVGISSKDWKIESEGKLVPSYRLESSQSNPVDKVEISKSELQIQPKRGNADWHNPAKQLPSKSDDLLILNRTITDLPPALVTEILNCLDPKELGIVSCVSTYLQRLASEHHAWKEFYHERWGLPVAPPSPASGLTDEKSWKALFVEREFRCKTFMGRYSVDLLHGHSEAVRTVFLLGSAKLIFTAGYDRTVRMWDMEDGLIAASRPLGCTIRAVSADTKLLVAGGTDGFIHCWRAVEGLQHLFDLRGSCDRNSVFRLWEHGGPITSLALDLTRIYSGSWDMTVRVWDRSSLKCTKVLRHSDWVWALVPHDTTVASTAGSDVYVWDTNSGSLMTVIQNAHNGNAYSLARSRTGDFLFTGGEDGAIHMFEIGHDVPSDYLQVATWVPHSGTIYSLAFEFPWLVSASSDGKLALIDVRKLMRSDRRRLLAKKQLSKAGKVDPAKAEPPQRMLHGFGTDLFSVGIGADRIVSGGEEGVVKVWNFTQALEIERRARALRGIRLENRMRRRKLQIEMCGKGNQRADQCSVAAKNSVNGDRSGVWHSKSGMGGKAKA
ncbi:F-box/WD-40 repeat-containing protein At5g21040 [Punica granatum]|uniref:F-box/WD-40 repeat-containing protein At5g21040 n=2 Tax=Punica granatum TaxID=22663 RepID=A0A6P8E749_PUNGR|nr:F-box/WD-40 repeat-containing protein At5g21040 [Punica granatum]XP_031402360.1 F-box/WD-40 repeat-containing protein At5g21040 [Punica granatum]OWM69074.1 hypothetical protein CDL15_Pgr025261 [Punica granatum]PKI73304.1 hypothetical protein CRG98_006242 [Punica granatum]